MSDEDQLLPGDFAAAVDNLYREEVFSDLHAASVRRLTPVTADGADDPGRAVMYIGETSIMTQVGALPVQFTIEAENLKAAFEYFPEGVREALNKLNERAKEMAREEASRIVVPGGAPPGMPGGVPGMPGGPGGKIVL